MHSLLWLALFCSLGIGALFAVRTVAGMTALGRAAPQAVAAGPTDMERPPLAKGDRLPSRVIDTAPLTTTAIDTALPTTAIDTVKITPTQAPKQSETPKDEIVSWHWHQGGKIVRHRAQ
jgi:hypothetical protein